MARSIKRNFFYSAFYQILNILVPLITTPILARTIGATGNGVFSYTQSIANYFVLFAQLGIANYGVREIARCRDDREDRSRKFAEIFAMDLAWGGIVVAVYVLYSFTYGIGYMPITLIWIFWVGGCVIDVTWLLNGCEEFMIPMMRSACTRLAGMAAIVLFVRGEGDVWIYVAANAVPCLLNALLVWPFVGRYVDAIKPSLRGALSHLRPNLVLFVPVVAVSLYTLLDKVMLGALAGMTQSGLYDYAENVSKMPLAVVTALGAVVLPRMTEVIAAGRREEAKRLVSTTMWFMECVALALCFGIVAVADDFALLFFGEGYGECASLMGVLSVIIPLISATNVIGVQYLVPSGRDRQFTLSVLAGAVVNIAINVAFIPSYGAMAAAVATVSAEVVVLLAQALMVRGELGLSRVLVELVPFAIAGLVMCGAVRMTAGFLGGSSSTVAGLFVEVVVGAAVYGLLSVGWCLVTKNEHFYQLSSSCLHKRLRR